MTTTPEQAFADAQKYLANIRPYAKVDRLQEDDDDYLATLQLIPPATEWPVGGGFVFVSKATGEVREIAPGEEITPGVNVMDKLDGMTDVKISSGE